MVVLPINPVIIVSVWFSLHSNLCQVSLIEKSNLWYAMNHWAGVHGYSDSESSGWFFLLSLITDKFLSGRRKYPWDHPKLLRGFSWPRPVKMDVICKLKTCFYVPRTLQHSSKILLPSVFLKCRTEKLDKTRKFHLSAFFFLIFHLFRSVFGMKQMAAEFFNSDPNYI